MLDKHTFAFLQTSIITWNQIKSNQIPSDHTDPLAWVCMYPHPRYLSVSRHFESQFWQINAVLISFEMRIFYPKFWPTRCADLEIAKLFLLSRTKIKKRNAFRILTFFPSDVLSAAETGRQDRWESSERPVQASSDNDLFKKISEYFSTYGSVVDLAVYLFWGTNVDGKSLVESRIRGGGFRSNSKLAHEVLDEWIKRSSTATPGALYQVLEIVRSDAAEDFKSKLVRRFWKLLCQSSFALLHELQQAVPPVLNWVEGSIDTVEFCRLSFMLSSFV